MARRPGSFLDLAARRSRSGVSLEEVARTTKISLASLRAIEAGEFHLLPGGIFTRSYLRQYAAAVGIDPAELLDAVEEPGPGSASAREEKSRASSTRKLWRSATNFLRYS